MVRLPVGAVLAPLALALVVSLLAGCRRGEEGFVLLPLVQAKTYTVSADGRLRDGLTFPRLPEVRTLEVDNERRPVVLTPAEPWFWRGRVPAGAVLHAGAQALPAVWQAAHRLEIEITARDGRTREILDVAHSPNRRQPQRWIDLDVDLSRWAGREITLEIAAALPGLPPRYRDANLVGWSPVTLTTTQEQRQAEHPNILFIVVDTLRADHLTPYGYSVHDTSPEIQRRLADHGMVVETAYSQAPWTLPSVVSFMTGRYAGELLGEDLAAYGIPDGVKPLAERLGALGYDTGGFFANPTLHAGAGFERGFNTFYAPPADVEWIRKHADELNRHAEPWLRAHQSRPFFLYVHYVDPHDPYENPDMAGGIGGRAQFMPEYTGAIGADWIHGIYSGKLQLADPAVDIPYINALYDGEIHYADRFIGALLDQLDPAVLKNTLIVLTADHGEELHDHGGWKHGQSLYNEQIHVPLIFRWDGRIPADKRLAGTVRLLDLVPTLVAAAGGVGDKADPTWEGTNILPALTGKAPLPRLAAFSEGMSGGPLRAAAVLEQRKLILFNREEPFRPADELQDYLWRKDLTRFERSELYDLTQDAGEHRNLAGEHPDWVNALQPIIHGQLGTELEGLWILPDGLPVGARLSGSVTFEHPPGHWAPYFLGPADKAELNGSQLRFDLLGDRLTKGVRIRGDFGRILAVAVTLDGKPLPAGAVRTGGGTGTPWSGSPMTPAGLRSRGWPLTSPPSPFLRLWIFDNAGAVERRTKADSETEKGLQNLGYIGKKK